MKKTKEVKSYTRKTKGGKTVTVKAHSASYDSAEDMAKNALKTKKGAGKELMTKTKNKSAENLFSQSDYTPDEANAVVMHLTHLYDSSEIKKSKATDKKLNSYLNHINSTLDKKQKNIYVDREGIKKLTGAFLKKFGGSKKSINSDSSKITESHIRSMFPEAYSKDGKTFYHKSWATMGKPKSLQQMTKEYSKFKDLGSKSSDEHISKIVPKSWSSSGKKSTWNFEGKASPGTTMNKALSKVEGNLKRLGWKESKKHQPKQTSSASSTVYVSPDGKYKMEKKYVYDKRLFKAKISKL